MSRAFCAMAMLLFSSTMNVLCAEVKLPKRGLTAMFTVVAEDDCGVPVKDVSVEAIFVLLGETFSSRTKKTDGSGKAIFEGRAIERVIFRANKDGYYPSRIERPLLRRPLESNMPSIEAGKWLPWNQQVKIVLVEKKVSDFVQMQDAALAIPSFDKAFGLDLMDMAVFDLESGDEHHIADFFIKLRKLNPRDSLAAPNGDISYSVILTACGLENQMMVQKQNAQSQYRFPTHLGASGWTNSLCFTYSCIDGEVVSTFPDRGYRGYNKSVLVQGETECVIFSYGREGKKDDCENRYVAIAPRFEISSSNILNIVWFTSPVSNRVFTAHATGF